MGVVAWLKKLFGIEPPLVRRFTAPGVCPYCGAPLRTAAARQCFRCGAKWRNDGPATGERSAVTTPGGSSAPSREPSALANLDLGEFAPLSAEEARKQARGLGPLWRSPFFGRTDLIPPANDPRTQVIDRAMVGQGLITPAELKEIHEVGAAMDRIRPDLALAGLQADAAVTRTKEEREALRQQKKAAAAERRRLRAEQVAHRRATDIVYLGRGVSRGLADRRANAERLVAQDLPVLATPADVAEVLELSIPRLRWLAYHTLVATRTHYITFDVPKRSGGIRRLASPHRELARCQRWILTEILNKLPVHDAAHGFVPGRSTRTGAVRHVGQTLVANLDLQDFFPSITFPRVEGLFRTLGYSPAVATILALLCTEAPRLPANYAGTRYLVAVGPRGLPQGACTSPALSNAISRRLDARLAGVAKALDWRYTRYADDLTFSSPAEAADKVGWLLARVRHIAQEEGFTVKESKTRVQRRNTAQVVTGIVVNDHPAVPRGTVRRLRAILHRAQHEGLAAQNRDGHPNFEAWLEGMIAYVQMVQPQRGGELQKAYESLRSAP